LAKRLSCGLLPPHYSLWFGHAEGDGRFTKADRRNFFTIARGSVQGCVRLLEVARRREFIDPAQHCQLRAAIEEIARMITGLINGLEKRKV